MKVGGALVGVALLAMSWQLVPARPPTYETIVDEAYSYSPDGRPHKKGEPAAPIQSVALQSGDRVTIDVVNSQPEMIGGALDFELRCWKEREGEKGDESRPEPAVRPKPLPPVAIFKEFGPTVVFQYETHSEATRPDQIKSLHSEFVASRRGELLIERLWNSSPYVVFETIPTAQLPAELKAIYDQDFRACETRRGDSKPTEPIREPTAQPYGGEKSATSIELHVVVERMRN